MKIKVLLILAFSSFCSMKLNLLLIIAFFSNFYSIQAMSEDEKETATKLMPLPQLHYPLQKNDFIRINHAFGKEKSTYHIRPKKAPALDLTKKLTLQEQSLYNQGSDQGKVEFPYSLRKFTDILQNLDSFEENQVLPIPISIDQKYLDIITEILVEADADMLPTSSEKERLERVKDIGSVKISFLSVPNKIKFLEVSNFLGIPVLSSLGINSLIRLGWELKDHIYKYNPETDKEELIVSDYTLYFIIQELKNRVVKNEKQFAWNAEIQEKIKSQINTLDQAIFLDRFMSFLTAYKSDLPTFLTKNPNAIKTFETFSIEMQQILQETRNQFRIYPQSSLRSIA